MGEVLRRTGWAVPANVRLKWARQPAEKARDRPLPTLIIEPRLLSIVAWLAAGRRSASQSLSRRHVFSTLGAFSAVQVRSA